MPSSEPVSNGSRFCSWISRQETTTEGLFVVSGVLGKEMAVSLVCMLPKYRVQAGDKELKSTSPVDEETR
jgi:hypothetical protein